MSTVATLVIEMAANVARLQSDMNSAKGMVGGAMESMTKAANVAKAALVGMAVGFVTKDLISMVSGAIDAADALDDLAKTTGVSASQLSALTAVGRTTGTTAETIAGMMTKLAKNMVDVDKPTSNAGQALKALGIHADDFKKMKPDEQMLAVAKAAEKFADGGGKAAAVEALMGKGAAANIPYFKDLAATQKLSAEMTDEQARAANEFKDNLGEIRAAGGGWAKELANGMVPALAAGSKAFLDVFMKSSGLREGLKKLVADGTIERWTTTAVKGLTYVMDGLEWLKRLFQVVGQAILNGFYAISSVVTGVGSAFVKMASGDFKGAMSSITGGVKNATEIMKDFGSTAAGILTEQTFGSKVRAAMDAMKGMKAATAAAATEQVKFAGDTDKATNAAKEQAKAHQEVAKAIELTSLKQFELTKITIEHTEVTSEAARQFAAEVERANEWQKTIDGVFSGLTDALFRAFEDGKGFMLAFRDTLVNTFKSIVLQPTIQAIMRPLAGAMGGVMGGVGSAVAGTGGSSGSGLMSGLGALGGLTGLGSMFGSGLGFGLIGGFGGGMGIAGTLGAGASMFTGGLAGGMAGLGSTIAGVGAMLGAVMPVIAGVYAIWKGFSRGPKKVTETGISGTLVGGEATAQLYERWKQSGGWIVGDRKGTRYKDLSEEMSAGLDQATAGIYGQVTEWTKALGLPAEQLAEVTHAISIKIGKDDAETQANIETALDGYRLALAARFEAVLEPFRNAGETLAETLQRLVGIQAMSEQLNQFGGVFSRIAALSVDAREELIGFAGGIEALLAKTQSFVSAYYSEGEQAAIAAKQIRDALGAIGISADVSSKSDFRALVEGLDVSTTEGRKQLDALLTISQTFAPVADYLSKAGGTLAQLADQAPQSEILRGMFEASQANAEVTQRTADGVDRVNDSIAAQTDATVSGLEALRAEVAALNAAVTAGLTANARSITGAIEALPA